MKRVWISTLIALIFVVGAICYSYYNRQNSRDFEESVSELITLQEPTVIAIEPSIVSVPDTISDSSETLSQTSEDETLLDEECCPDDEVGELYEIHTDNFVEGKPSQASKSVDNSYDPDWYRKSLIKKHGYSPDIDRYLELDQKMSNGGRKHFLTVLEWARLECVYNPSLEAEGLRDELEEFAQIPEHMRSDLWFE